MYHDYRDTGVFDREMMSRIASAVGVRYLVQINLGSLKQDARGRFSLLGLSLFNTQYPIRDHPLVRPDLGQRRRQHRVGRDQRTELCARHRCRTAHHLPRRSQRSKQGIDRPPALSFAIFVHRKNKGSSGALFVSVADGAFVASAFQLHAPLKHAGPRFIARGMFPKRKQKSLLDALKNRGVE